MPKNPESQRWANIHAAVEYHFLHRFGHPPSTKVPVNGTEVNLSQILGHIRQRGYPKVCPAETRDLIELYRDMGAFPKRGESGWVDVHAAVEYHVANHFGQPPSTKVPVNGTEADLSQALRSIRQRGFPKDFPAETRDLIELYRDMGAFSEGGRAARGESGWVDVHAAVEYHFANHFGQPPSKAVPVNDIEVNLSKVLNHIRRQGFPKACPVGTRDLIELYRDMGAFPVGSTAKRGESGWADVHAAVEYHVANRFGRPPSKKVPVGDMEVDLSTILSDIRQRGYPKDCPVATSDLIESQSAAGAFGRGSAGSMPKRQPQPVPEMDLDLDPELVQGLGVSGLSAWPGQAGGVATAAALVLPAAGSQHAPAGYAPSGYAPYDPAPGSSSNNRRSHH
ncbi:hypothetical protein [Micromonospora yangpuensis]|uniref:Uncharacterized protein n=1 Tax=Micromonospora yangpuensis TaxID=683228 RepID=A0A1C6VCE8_9ACTN|nr:hypothetical protein [Micromonospora yangpuensis]GGM12494.1 hypothetical protein GCM10012279_33220 [Micromonospora yangpuensis]SCL63724.1 hypothetical protein GA0070617_5282 [Micromonospora yangpuensis]